MGGVKCVGEAWGFGYDKLLDGFDKFGLDAKEQDVVDFKGEKIMFLEVYAVNLDNYSKETDLSKKPENRRFIEMTSVRIRYSDLFEDRAEIILANGDILLAAGSYEEIVDRITHAEAGQYARLSN